MSPIPRSILALDLGTKLGWALLRADGRVESGQEMLAPKTGEGPGRRFAKFHRWLIDLKARAPELAAIHYELVVAISTRGGMPHNAQASHIYGGLVAILQMFGEHHGITYCGHNVATVKKQFTGSGRAQKCDVIAQCRVMGFKPDTDNEADALAVLHVATGRCSLLTMSGASPKGPRAPKPHPTLEPGQPAF